MVMNSINKRGLCDLADRKDAPCTPTAKNFVDTQTTTTASRHDGGGLGSLPRKISRKLCQCLLVFYLRFNTASILLIDEDKPVLTCGLIGRLIACFIIGFALGILSGCWEYQPA